MTTENTSNQPFSEFLTKRIARAWDFAFAPKPAIRPQQGRRRIAFIKQGLFSYSNVRIAEQLTRNFPDHEIEIIDIRNDVLKANKSIVVENLFSIVRYFGWDILRGRRTVRKTFYRTPFLFRTLRKLLAERFRGREHEYDFTIQTQSLFDGSIPGVPHFVYTDHTHLTNLYYPAFDPVQLLPRRVVDLERLIYTRATRVFVMGSHVARSLTEFYGIAPEKVACVYAGSNVDPEPLPLENDGYRKQHLVFIGVEWERKGGPRLIEALRLVREKYPGVTLTVLGCAPDIREPGVEVLGKVSHEEVKLQLVRASMMVFPTQIEPFGIAPIESFLHKIPVIASRIGAMPDIVTEGQSGILVDPSDVAGFATAINSLLADPEKARRFGERGRELVCAKFSWAEAGARIRRGVLEALEERRSILA